MLGRRTRVGNTRSCRCTLFYENSRWLLSLLLFIAIYDKARVKINFFFFLLGTLSEVRFENPNNYNETSTVTNINNNNNIERHELIEIGRTDLKCNEVCYINGNENITKTMKKNNNNSNKLCFVFSFKIRWVFIVLKIQAT